MLEEIQNIGDPNSMEPQTVGPAVRWLHHKSTRNKVPKSSERKFKV